MDHAEAEQADLAGSEALVTVDLPPVPPIVLPDLSVLSDTGETVRSSLGDLAGPEGELEVLGASCAADGGDLVYQGSERNSFFDIATDGPGVYSDHGVATELDIVVNPDGSGRLRDQSGPTDLEIIVNADGSGEYHDHFREVDIVVNADETGTYRDTGVATDVEIAINGDGSGRFRDDSGPTDLEIIVNADGSGEFHDRFREADLVVNADGSEFTFRDTGVATDVLLEVHPDGSGRYEDRSGPTDLEITVDADGNGWYADHFREEQFTFTTDVGILDPELLVASPMPTFVVADRFPPLETLGRLSPPCASVIRLDADALFDFDSDQLRPEAVDVVAQVAEALQGTDLAIEVDGHTDSIGDDAYNLDLAARRADNFAAALVSAGVTNPIETVSYGETRPVAPNERADGSDNPAGRQQNRRIEVVIPE